MLVGGEIKPVLLLSAADGGTNKVTVFLQLIQSLLNGLVDGLLDRLTHPVDLVHTAARLNKTKAHMCIRFSTIAQTFAAVHLREKMALRIV